MIKGQPSRTALLTCVQRAHHYLAAPEPKILRDDYAVALSGFGSDEAVYSYINKMIDAFATLSDIKTGTALMARIEGAVCMRSRVVEEKLVAARQRGIKQLVILGAGLDSTAYRCKSLTDGIQVFEVDHPATQQWKKEQLELADIPVPDNVNFVGFDFEQQTLAEALQTGGVSQAEMTFFAWLGVTMYLTDEAICASLAVMGAYPKGSQVVLDFISPSYVKAGKVKKDSVQNLAEVVAQMGEPMKSKYFVPDLDERLKTAGFSDVDFLTPEWLVDNYLGGDTSSFAMDATSILSAVV